jgi:2-keto-4-pentenoate hydratase/2-oxohepta-3-ene-1,7-dioic acid hydratase in catechol pathway
MRFAAFRTEAGDGLGACTPEGIVTGLLENDPRYPGNLRSLLARGEGALRDAYERLLAADRIDAGRMRWLPPIPNPGKIVCVGLNYAEHAAESGFKPPAYPAFFVRFPTSLVGHESPLVRPRASDQLDYEAELAAIVGRRARHVPKERALEYVAGYSMFNDGSVREYQYKSPQWTVGKNFDSTGGFGPVFVTADELPPGGKGLKVEMRVSGTVRQSASTSEMIFDVATLLATLSEAMTLEPGDVLVTGTPSGVGKARTPPLFLKPGDVCEVSIGRIGTLRNPVIQEPIDEEQTRRAP